MQKTIRAAWSLCRPEVFLHSSVYHSLWLSFKVVSKGLTLIKTKFGPVYFLYVYSVRLAKQQDVKK